MATKAGRNGYKTEKPFPLPEDQLQPLTNGAQAGAREKKPSGDQHWDRLEARVWMVTLLAGTCFLYCARSTLPICAVSISQQYGWNKKQTGLALGSFFWGYCLTQIAGGHLSDRVGGERVLMVSAMLWGSLTLLTPLATHATTQTLLLVSLLRFLMGLLQGVHFPALSSVFAKRVRDQERGFICSFVGCGSQCGTLLIGGAGSLLQDWFSWDYVFYFAGFLPLIWSYYLGTYLIKEKEGFVTFSELGRGLSTTSSKSNMPWRQLLKKAPVWAVLVAQFSVASTSFTLFSWIPIFFKTRFPESKGVIFNVVPWLVTIPAALLSGCLVDHLIRTGYKPIFIRKLMQIMGMGVYSIFVFLLGHSSSFPQAMLFTSLAVALQTFNHSGLTVNIQDLAPSCSGFLFGVANTGGSLLGILWVYLSGYLLDISGSWESMFHLVVFVNVFGLLVYLEYAKAERVDIEVLHPVIKV